VGFITPRSVVQVHSPLLQNQRFRGVYLAPLNYLDTLKDTLGFNSTFRNMGTEYQGDSETPAGLLQRLKDAQIPARVLEWSLAIFEIIKPSYERTRKNLEHYPGDSAKI
jgi:hypothetical protein